MSEIKISNDCYVIKDIYNRYAVYNEIIKRRITPWCDSIKEIFSVLYITI